MSHGSQSLSRRLPALITALVAAAVLIVSGLAYDQLQRAVIRAAASALGEESLKLADIFEETVWTVRREARSTAADGDVRALLEPRRDTAGVAPAALVAVIHRVPQIASVTLTDPEGVAVASAGAAADPASIRSAVRHDDISRPVAYGGSIGYYFAAPVLQGRRDTLGFVVVHRRIERRAAERLIGVVGRSASLHVGDSSWTHWLSLAGTAAPPPRMTESRPTRYDSDGTPMLGGVVPVPSTSWLLAVGIPVAAAHADARPFLYVIIAVALVAMVLGGFGAWLLSRQVTRPLAEIATAAGDVARGDYTRRVAVQRRDEFGSLAESFNVMAGQVETTAQRLGQHALELEHTNQELRRSEEKYRRLVDSSHEGICTVGPNGAITYANRRMAELLGYDHAELVGRSLFDFMSERGAFEGRSRFARRLRGISETWELALQRQDGSTIWVSESASSLFDGDGSFAGALYMFTDVTERREAQEQLRSSERYFRAMIEHASDMICIIDEAGRFTYASPAQERYIGFTPMELVGKEALRFIHPDDVATVGAAIARAHEKPGASVHARFRHRHKDGSWRDLAAVATNLLHDPDVRGVVVNSHDYTDQLVLQRQLAQSQKMEAVGLLAGGVAHDFNNLLTVVTTYGELLVSDLPAESGSREDARAIIDAATRAAALTRQLLAFSRQQVMQPAVLNLNAAVGDMQPMLRRVLRENIAIELSLSAAQPLVFADPTQIEQVLLNLAVNARDAMADGGTITIETSDVEIASGGAPTPDLAPGVYVMLGVRDTGVGMSAATKARAFEPFFTTKGTGQGTGLGLATVYGIVRQSGGQIVLESEQGQGTAFRVYLPRIEGAAAAAERIERDHSLYRGSETILLVEDEMAVRVAARRILERAGYSVIEAASGNEALALVQSTDRSIDVLLTDMVMPGMSGRELATQLRAARPAIHAAFMSGHTEDAILRRGALAPDEVFIQKPFTPLSLTLKVHEVLGRGVA